MFPELKGLVDRGQDHDSSNDIAVEPLITGCFQLLCRAELISSSKASDGRTHWCWRRLLSNRALAERCAKKSRDVDGILRELDRTDIATRPSDHGNGSDVMAKNYSAAEALRASLGNKRKRTPAASKGDIDKFTVSFLGTGSASPSKHRSGSAILIHGSHLETDYGFLLDVGESCVSQMFHMCKGDDGKLQEILASLEFVAISHHHADHSCGLPMLLETLHHAVLRGSRRKDKKVFVIVGTGLRIYYEFITSISGVHYLVEFINLGDILHSSCLTPALEDFLMKSRVLKSITGIPVNHCREAMGFLIEFSNDLRMVYSGDCRPCDRLISVGKNCDLLIHEATFDDLLVEHAMRKRHSTISEALSVARKMNARHLVLTHFSQRYPKIPNVANQQVTFVLAFDLLSFRFPSQLPSVTRFSSEIANIYDRLESKYDTDQSVNQTDLI